MKKRLAMQKLFRLACDECGSELVEFALSAMILMGITVGVIGFALAMYTYHCVSAAAQEGARFAMVRGYTWSEYTAEDCSTSTTNFTMVYNCTASGTDIQNYVKSLATGGINPAGLTIDTTSADIWPGKNPDGTTTGCAPNANSQGCVVKVKVSYTFDFFKLFPLANLSNWTMSATAEGVILE